MCIRDRQAGSNSLDHLQGTWKTGCSSVTQFVGAQVVTTSMKDVLSFSGSEMTETVTAFSDEICAQPRASIAATYSSVVVGNNDPAVSGATQITVVVGTIQLTPLDAVEIVALNNLGCGSGWSIGVAQDVTGITACGMEASGTTLYQIFSLNPGTGSPTDVLSVGGPQVPILSSPNFHDQAGTTATAIPTNLMLQTYSH